MPQFRKYFYEKWYADQLFSLWIATKNQTCRYIRSFVVGCDEIAKTFFYFSFSITTILRPRSGHFVTHGNENKKFRECRNFVSIFTKNDMQINYFRCESPRNIKLVVSYAVSLLDLTKLQKRFFTFHSLSLRYCDNNQGTLWLMGTKKKHFVNFAIS